MLRMILAIIISFATLVISFILIKRRTISANQDWDRRLQMKLKHLRLTTSALVLFAYGMQGVPSLHSQEKGQPICDCDCGQRCSSPSEDDWEKAANRWQHVAVDMVKQTDTVTPDVRAQRNAHWLDDPTRNMIMHQVLSGVQFTFSFSGVDPELPSDAATPPQHSVWAIATFDSFHVYAFDPDEKLLYTEINLRIDTVIRADKNLHLAPGSVIDAFRFGGMAKTHKGEIVTSIGLSPRRYDLQAGHKYLLCLLPPDNNGGTFTTEKWWDITSGKVQPDTQDEVERAVRGESKLAGMTVSDLIKYLQTALPPVPKE